MSATPTRFNPKYFPLAATISLFVLMATLGSLRYDGFFSAQVFLNLLIDNAFLVVVAVGMTFVILSGGIDLSVGSVVAFTGVFLAVTIRDGAHPYLMIPAILAIAAVFGAGMGAMIHYLQTPPFIVTLAGMFLARGGCYLLTTESVPIDHPAFDALKQLYWVIPSGGRLTFVAMVMLAVFALGMIVAHKTRFGTYV
ncbi:MAG: sugar ABC transporter permease YjfF, partial [Comamonadaceae bacterium]